MTFREWIVSTAWYWWLYWAAMAVVSFIFGWKLRQWEERRK